MTTSDARKRLQEARDAEAGATGRGLGDAREALAEVLYEAYTVDPPPLGPWSTLAPYQQGSWRSYADRLAAGWTPPAMEGATVGEAAVEAAARALCVLDGEEPDLDENMEYGWEPYREEATAALTEALPHLTPPAQAVSEEHDPGCRREYANQIGVDTCDCSARRTTCTWCAARSTGTAAHNDGDRYPSCGAPDHGLDGTYEHLTPPAPSPFSVEARAEGNLRDLAHALLVRIRRVADMPAGDHWDRGWRKAHLKFANELHSVLDLTDPA